MANCTCKFKVGDKIIGNHPSRYTFTNKGWKGIVTKVQSDGYFTAIGEGNARHNGEFFGLDPQYFDLIPTEEKIVITHNGKVTTATLYGKFGSKETATASCSPEDTFDFNVGAALALERLTKKVNPPEDVEWCVVDRKAKVGDYIRLNKCCMFSFNKPGDILKVDGVRKTGTVFVYGKNHPRKAGFEYEEWNYAGYEYEVVEKVNTPKYYNGKVVCVKSDYGWWTVGKVYEVVDGRITADDGDTYPKFRNGYTDAEDVRHAGCTNGCDHNRHNEFIPLVE